MHGLLPRENQYSKRCKRRVMKGCGRAFKVLSNKTRLNTLRQWRSETNAHGLEKQLQKQSKLYIARAVENAPDTSEDKVLYPRSNPISK